MRNYMKLFSPEIYKDQYCKGILTRGEYFQSLLACLSVYSVERIAYVLDDKMIDAFRLFIAEYSNVTSDDQLVRINNPPVFGVREIAMARELFLKR